VQQPVHHCQINVLQITSQVNNIYVSNSTCSSVSSYTKWCQEETWIELNEHLALKVLTINFISLTKSPSQNIPFAWTS